MLAESDSGSGPRLDKVWEPFGKHFAWEVKHCGRKIYERSGPIGHDDLHRGHHAALAGSGNGPMRMVQNTVDNMMWERWR